MTEGSLELRLERAPCSAILRMPYRLPATESRSVRTPPTPGGLCAALLPHITVFSLLTLLCLPPPAASGHCPHHEVPRTVNWALKTWIASGGSLPPVAPGATVEVEEASGRVIRVVHRDGAPNTAPTNLISKVVAWLEGLGKGREANRAS